MTPRSRLLLASSIGATIALGLASRRWPAMFPDALGKYPGDALWALMVYLGMAFMRPGDAAWRIAGLALAFCFLIEVSQLYQSPWINGIRGTTLGHLVLGSAFDSHDLWAYTAGVAVGAITDLTFRPAWRR